MKRLALLCAIAGAAIAAACSGDDPSLHGNGDTTPITGPTENPPNSAPAGANDPTDLRREALPDPLEGLAQGEDQLKNICGRNESGDLVMLTLCGKNRPTITSLADLQKSLNLGFSNPKGANGAGGNPGFAVLGHSSSLVTRDVSAINPRAFVFPGVPGNPVHIPGWVVIGFTRGENFLEISAEDPKTLKVTFYLFRFSPSCEPNCGNADMLTAQVESGWKGWTLYNDTDLVNTIADCRHCHQPDQQTSPGLRMQELQDPWTHWFRNDRDGGKALLADFVRAHGQNETYGGIPGEMIAKSDGKALEDFVAGQGFPQQPNEFVGKTIEKEVQASQSTQPDINVPGGTSSTWQTLYNNAIQGKFIPPPYHDVKVTDPNKLQFATDAYLKFSSGQLSKDQFPDIRRVFLDAALEDMTQRTKTGLSGREVLTQACVQCHNPNLDQSVTKSRFDVTRLSEMSQAEKQLAIARMKLPTSNRLRMPPAMMRNLTDDAIQAAVNELNR